MEINEYGQVIVTESEAFDALYSGRIIDLNDLFLRDSDSVARFNSSIDKNADRIPHLTALKIPDITISEFDKQQQTNWFMPANYCPNLVEQLFNLCKTEEQRVRVSTELELFIQHNMMDLLFYLKYLVDTLRENNVVWGVGRGSSVASYVLYLIGVHKIDSIKYNLDIAEFLK